MEWNGSDTKKRQGAIETGGDERETEFIWTSTLFFLFLLGFSLDEGGREGGVAPLTGNRDT